MLRDASSSDRLIIPISVAMHAPKLSSHQSSQFNFTLSPSGSLTNIISNWPTISTSCSHFEWTLCYSRVPQELNSEHVSISNQNPKQVNPCKRHQPAFRHAWELASGGTPVRPFAAASGLDARAMVSLRAMSPAFRSKRTCDNICHSHTLAGPDATSDVPQETGHKTNSNFPAQPMQAFASECWAHRTGWTTLSPILPPFRSRERATTIFAMLTCSPDRMQQRMCHKSWT